MLKVTQRNIQKWYQQLVNTDNSIILNGKHNKETVWVNTPEETLFLVNYNKKTQKAHQTSYSKSGFHTGYKEVEAKQWR